MINFVTKVRSLGTIFTEFFLERKNKNKKSL